MIIEDGYDSEFRYGGRPLDLLQGLDTAGDVIYPSTFSKVLFPSLRLGSVPPPSLYSPVLSVKWLTDRHFVTREQNVIATFIAERHFAGYIRRMQRIYLEGQGILLSALEQLDAVHPAGTGGRCLAPGRPIAGEISSGRSDVACRQYLQGHGLVRPALPVSGMLGS